MGTYEKDGVRVGLAPLFERADREGLWFFCSYQRMWFSPKALRAAHAEGRMLWGAVNWTLRDPEEYRAEAEKDVADAMKERDRVAQAILEGRLP